MASGCYPPDRAAELQAVDCVLLMKTDDPDRRMSAKPPSNKSHPDRPKMTRSRNS